MNASPAVVLLAYADDPLARLATRLIEAHASRLPDLSGCVVLLPGLQAAPRLRRLLLQAAASHGVKALLGPRIQTLSGFLDELVPPPLAVTDPIGRELMLVEALRDHARLFGNADPWQVGESLLALFDEMSLRGAPPPATEADFLALLQRAYAIAGEPPAPLGREARLVHTLWNAWHEQHRAERRLDRAAATRQQLNLSLERLPADSRLYLAGFQQLSQAEALWLRHLLEQDRAELYLQGQPGADGYHPDAVAAALLAQLGLAAPDAPTASARGGCLDAVYAHGQGNLAARARAAGGDGPSPLGEGLRLFAAAGAEQEAEAVALQVRAWLHDGRRQVGIVTEDRRLARRVRALLERSGVLLGDTAGWALSTSRAAAALERWLEAVEEEFAHPPLLDLLKSPFVFPDLDREARLAAVYRLEQDVILHENVGRGLERYRSALQARARRLGWSGAQTAELARLLEDLGGAAAPLLAARAAGRQAPQRLLQALRQSLAALGMDRALERDPAGSRVMQALEAMEAALAARSLDMDWLEFRGWLGRTLEGHNFRLADGDGRVQLMSLEQSGLARFDALVIAGAEREHLPGGDGANPFFNDGVRTELGLGTHRERLNRRFFLFRRLLEAAPELLITLRREQDGEEIIPSPWVEALSTFHRQAWNDDLHHPWLGAWIDAAKRGAAAGTPLPPPSTRPAPVLPAELLPGTLSVSAHQRLIDCPYRFFAADCLALRPLEEVREALAKSDYGERVHRCLQAFHGDVPGLPGPFPEPVDEEHRPAAVALLEEISRAVFARDLEDNFQHRGWLQRWEAAIPAYVEWQIGHARDWQVDAVERGEQRPLASGRSLKGRLDRVDRGPGGLDVIDYKTGGVPKQAEVDRGEAVQLPSYALLLEAAVARVEYVKLERDGVENRVALEGEALQTLTAEVGARLVHSLTQIEAGAPLPAHGDPATCAFCEAPGICRREAWAEPAP